MNLLKQHRWECEAWRRAVASLPWIAAWWWMSRKRAAWIGLLLRNVGIEPPRSGRLE